MPAAHTPQQCPCRSPTPPHPLPGSPVGDVQEAVLVLVVGIHVRHQCSCMGTAQEEGAAVLTSGNTSKGLAASPTSACSPAPRAAAVHWWKWCIGARSQPHPCAAELLRAGWSGALGGVGQSPQGRSHLSISHTPGLSPPPAHSPTQRTAQPCPARCRNTEMPCTATQSAGMTATRCPAPNSPPSPSPSPTRASAHPWAAARCAQT